MTEYETNPQQPGQPDPGTPDETAELRQQGGGEPAASGDADAGAARGRVWDQWSEPLGTQPAQAEPAAQPEQAVGPEPSRPAAAPASPSAAPASPSAAGPYTPPAGPYAPSPGPYPPAGPYAPPPGSWAPPAGSESVPSAPPFAAAPPPTPPRSPWQQPTQHTQPTPVGWQPSSAVPGSGAPAYDTQPMPAGNQPPPIWAAQPGPGEAPTTVLTPMGAPAGPGMYQQPSRAGRRLAAGAAVLALAVGSGILGGWVALQANDDPITTSNVGSATNASNRNASPAPVINRDDLANVAAAVQPSVVSIKTDEGEGSGVIFDDQGDIVTNNHVVASANGDNVTVTFSDGKNTTAKIVNTDARTDLAVVKVSNVSGLTPAKIGDSGAMRVGDTVLALGSPLGLEGTVTAGIISALDRTIQVSDEEQQQQNPFQRQQSQVQSISGLLQTDAPINPGNSGGALANTKGEVIGINNAIAGNSGGNIGVGFAIPSNKMKSVADQLIKGGKVSHPFLGVQVGEATNGGALVQGVTGNSPAAKVGMQEGDVITKFGDKTISGADDLISAVQSGNVGDRVQITYTRNGDEKTATVTLADAS